MASLLALGVVSALAWRLHYDSATRWVVLLVAASKAVESLSDVVAGLLQKHERLDQVAVSLMVRGVLSLAAFGKRFCGHGACWRGVAALVATWSTVFVLYDLWRTRGVLAGTSRRYFRVDGARLRRLLVVSAPLGVVMTLISLNVNLPRYMFVKYLGEADLGIFASLAYVLVAMTLIAHALGQAASARLSRMFAAHNIPAFKRATETSLMGATIGLLSPLARWLFGRPVLSLVYGPLYAEHVGLLALMATTAGLHCITTFLIYATTAARSFKMQAVMKALAICVTGTLSFFLIPTKWAYGSAIALLVSEAVFAIGMAQCLALAIRRGAKA